VVAASALETFKLNLGHSVRNITKEDIPQLFDDEVLTSIPSRYIPRGYTEGDAMLAITDPRQQRGMQIAATTKLLRKGSAWIVPSQSGNGRYTVVPDEREPHCSCPDHESHGFKCKHIFAVEYVIRGKRTLTAARPSRKR
jgi:hypothetical protein